MLRKVKSQSHKVTKSPALKDLFLCLLSGALLILSFPTFNLWILAWVGFVPLFFALKGKSKGRAFLLSYLTGVLFWFGIIYWLIHVTLAGLILLVLYLALYFGFFGLFIKIYEPRTTNHEPLIFASIWITLEYIRSHLLTGFPWALLGYSQYLNLPMIQISDISGAWGVSFLVMMVNVAIYSCFVSGVSCFEKTKKYLVTLLGMVITLSYGYYKIYEPRTTNHEPRIKISVVQGNIPQELKWAPDSRDFIVDRYLALTKETLRDKPDLILWPEAALPVVLEEEPRFFEKVKGFVSGIKIPLLLGAVTSNGNLYYNSALLISSEGETLAKYDKLHLVPFGEYIPLRKVFRFLETVVPIGDFTTGREYTIFRSPGHQVTRSPVNFSVLICFEDLFPELSREFTKKGAQFLVNITNDAWFGETPSPYQHLQASVFRAVENRVNLVRSANTGVSGFIAPTGKIISLVQDQSKRNIFIDGCKTQEIAIIEKKPTFYTRYGNVFIFVNIVYVVIFVYLAKTKRTKSTKQTKKTII